MKSRKKQRIITVTLLMVTLFAAFCLGIDDWRLARKKQLVGEDADALRNIISEAYVNIIKDPEFVNTSEHKDGRLWAWVVTYRIGDYTNTIRAANEW